jgi:hypothetical protein
MTHTITLDVPDADALTDLASAHPGVTLHLTHLAVFRLGLRQASSNPSLLAVELAAIGQERRERRRRARDAKTEVGRGRAYRGGRLA